MAPNEINIKKDLLAPLSPLNYSTSKGRCKILHLPFLGKVYLKKMFEKVLCWLMSNEILAHKMDLRLNILKAYSL